jgi:short-subunit dehydrogenase
LFHKKLAIKKKSDIIKLFPRRLKNEMEKKSILITGCSSGIGLTAATLLKQRGHRVFATARKETDVLRLKEQGFESTQLDVNHPLSIKNALQDILQKSGGTLDALFNNAGYIQMGAVEDLSRDMDRAQFETNVFGAMELIRSVLPIMRSQGHGRIIQNGSLLGIIAMAYCGSYNASKFALEGYTNTLRLELRKIPIHVSIIVPGPILTELRNNAYAQFQETIGNKKSHYQQIYKEMEKSYFKRTTGAQVAIKPDAVGKKLIHALESSHPKAHYYVGLPAHAFAFLRRILPDSMMDWILTKLR